MNLLYFYSKFLKKARFSSIKNCSVHSTSKIESGSLIVNTSIAKHSFCGYDCEIINCEIGSFCSIANRVIIGGGKHPLEWVGTSPVFYEGRDSVKAKFSNHKRSVPKITSIGNDVWIGECAMIKQGVKIGDGAVIGMGSIVTKDVPPYSIYAGNPAKEIRMRFDSTIIEELLKIKWWDIPEKDLKYYAKYFKNPEVFIKKYNK